MNVIWSYALSNDHDTAFWSTCYKIENVTSDLRYLVALEKHFETKLKIVEENHRVKSNSV